MNYPLISEYVESIKSAADNFDALNQLRPVKDASGTPVMSSGNFAVVFKMKDEQTGKLYAVKCFTKDQEHRTESYRLIAEELKQVDSEYLTSLQYLENELFVDSGQTSQTEFPVVLMDWVEGKTLDKYLREHLDDTYELEMLAYRFSQLAQWIIPQPFAHGDLKPDNILVREDGTLVLVDYDGMYVPAMQGQKARELGSPDFRHPLRTEDEFDEHIDDFPVVSILLSLKAISVNPSLLEQYGASDRLLFSENDYQALHLSNTISACHLLLNDCGFAKIYSLFMLLYSSQKISGEYLFMLELDVSDSVKWAFALQCMNKGKETQAYHIWLALAQKGNAQAQNSVGVCFYTGKGITQNYDEAIKWITLSANQNNSKALYNLSTCYENGDGVKQDYQKAFNLCKKSAKQNYPAAQYDLFTYYYQGIGVEKDLEKSLLWLKKAVSQQFPEAQYILGIIYEEGKLVEKNEEKAFNLYKKSAEQGNIEAQQKLGDVYRCGLLGVIENPKKAFQWYLKAAEQNDAYSQFYVGYFYASGYGVSQNYNNAVKWYNLAAVQNDKAALNNLGICYEYGRGVDIDIAKAVLYYEKAAALGNVTAQRNLANCYSQGTGVEKDVEKEFYWRLEAAKRHDVDSQYKIAKWYFKGYGMQRSQEDALIWYAKHKNEGDKKDEITNAHDAFLFFEKKATEADVDSLYIVGKCYEYGVGIASNKITAFEYFQKAANLGYYKAFLKLRLMQKVNIESLYIKIAKDFTAWLQNNNNITKENDFNCIFSLLDNITIVPDKKLQIHIAGNTPVGDRTYFYIETSNPEEIWKYLRVNCDNMGVWQAYLLETSSRKMPVTNQLYSYKRRYIYSRKDIDNFSQDILDSIQKDYVFPCIGIFNNIGIVSCCYWNSWEGLVQETVRIVFSGNKIEKVEYLPSKILYKYDCGNRF